jgi:hypothetical protein
MIAILISTVMIGQTNALDTGAKMRHEANKMIMGMQNVPYDVADVLNGSNYSVEQATEIAAQRRQMRAVQEQREMAAMQKQLHAATKDVVKGWSKLNAMYDKIVDESFVLPDQERPTMRGFLRKDIDMTTKTIEMRTTSRNVRMAAKAHLKKAEAALAVLDKQGSPPDAQKKAP